MTFFKKALHVGNITHPTEKWDKKAAICGTNFGMCLSMSIFQDWKMVGMFRDIYASYSTSHRDVIVV